MKRCRWLQSCRQLTRFYKWWIRWGLRRHPFHQGHQSFEQSEIIFLFLWTSLVVFQEEQIHLKCQLNYTFYPRQWKWELTFKSHSDFLPTSFITVTPAFPFRGRHRGSSISIQAVFYIFSCHTKQLNLLFGLLLFLQPGNSISAHFCRCIHYCTFI